MTRVAIVHDWLTGQRGGENVLVQVLALLPEADLFVLSHVRGSVSEAIERRRPRSTCISRVPFWRDRPGLLLPLLPRAVRSLDLERYDAVLSLCHCVAHGGSLRPGARRVAYCLTPMRYAWDLYDVYAERGAGLGPLTPLARWAGARLRDRLRAWDRAAGASQDAVACISEHVRARVLSAWGRDARVVHPPVDVEAFARASAGVAPGERYVAVSAVRPNKRLELVASAFRRLGRPLDVVGDGSPRDLARLRELGGPGVAVHGRVSDAKLRELVAHARAFVHAADEEFGIAPVEALAAGRPVIAYARSGVAETLAPEEDGAPLGVLFDAPDADALVEAVRRFEEQAARASFPPERLRARAGRYSRERFRSAFARFLREEGGEALARSLAPEAEGIAC